MRRRMLIALVGLLAVGVAGSASAATLDFTGTLSLRLSPGVPAFVVPGAGAAQVTDDGSFHLLSVLLPAGAFGPSTSIITLTNASTASIRLTAGCGSTSRARASPSRRGVWVSWPPSERTLAVGGPTWPTTARPASQVCSKPCWFFRRMTCCSLRCACPSGPRSARGGVAHDRSGVRVTPSRHIPIGDLPNDKIWEAG